MLQSLQRKILIRALSASTKGLTDLVISQGEKNRYQPNAPSKDVYYSIKGLPFDRFLQLYIDDDIRALYHGNTEPDWLELAKAKQRVLDEYADESGGDDNIPFIMLQANIARLESRMSRCKEMLDSQAVYHNEDIAKQLTQLGIPNEIALKRFQLELDKLYKELKAKTGKTVKPTFKLFYQILAAIDPKLQPKDIDTLSFCVQYNTLKKKWQKG